MIFMEISHLCIKEIEQILVFCIMGKHEQIQLFNSHQVRSVWDDEKEQWYFAVIDVVQLLTDCKDATDYIKKMRKRDPELAKGWGQIVTPLSLMTNGGRQRINCATQTGIFRIIQSIPSQKAEPFKLWMAHIATLRLDQMQNPELNIEQAILDYKHLGYDDKWINQRIKTIEIRKGLTDEWKRGGITNNEDFALLTDLMSKTWSGMTTKEYKQLKRLKKENLRDNMTNLELLLNAIAEETATQISKERNPEGLRQNAVVAKEGADVAKSTRNDIESRLGHSVISSERAIDHTNPEGMLPLNETDSFTEE